MSITLVGMPQSGGQGSGGNVTLTFDVTPQENDVVVLLGGCHSGTVGPSSVGYTSIDVSTVYDHFGAWYKVMGSTPDVSVTGLGDGSAQDGTCYVSYVLRGVDTTVIDAAPTVATGPAASQSIQPAQIVTQTDGALVIVAGQVPTANVSNFSWDNAIGIYQVETHPYHVVAATHTQATAGAVTPPTVSFDANATNGWTALTIAIKPAAAAATSPIHHNGGILSLHHNGSPITMHLPTDPTVLDQYPSYQTGY